MQQDFTNVDAILAFEAITGGFAAISGEEEVG